MFGRIEIMSPFFFGLLLDEKFGENSEVMQPTVYYHLVGDFQRTGRRRQNFAARWAELRHAPALLCMSLYHEQCGETNECPQDVRSASMTAQPTVRHDFPLLLRKIVRQWR